MKIQTFTRHLVEESTGYAKLKSNNFRSIRFNNAEKAIMQNKTGAAIAGVSVYIEENPELYDESYAKLFSEIKSQRRLEDIHDQEFEVFYSFSNALRGSKKYGHPNWSARTLYEFLCAGFNGGERFIDTYFNRLFPSRPCYLLLEEIVEKVQTGIETKWNDGNLKGGQWAAFYRFQAAEMDYLQRSLSRFSSNIREDIILCLRIGLIPMNFSLAPSTIKKRLSLGLPGGSPFYATSWLINQIEVHVILGAADSGKLFYSDTYKGVS